jgi:adenine-specific DNA-methyltransferase
MFLSLLMLLFQLHYFAFLYMKNKTKIILGNQKTLLKNKVVLTWQDKDRVAEDDHKEKTFTNFQRHTTRGKEKVTGFDGKDNLIIKGDNLLVLHSIKDIFRNRVKLIYIDPPYNTGNNKFNYNDDFEHSNWLSFMRNRLEVAAQFLSEDGTIWINIDDKESHYLKVLCDEIFGRENFVINFIWQKKYSPANDAKWFSDTHDHILVFAKNKQSFKPNLLPRSDAMNKRYANPDNDTRGVWKPGGFSVKTYSKEYDYPVTTPSGKIVHPPKGSCWQTSKKNFCKKLADNRIWFGAKGSSKPQIKQFLSEVQQGTVAKSIWSYEEVGHNQVSRSEIIKLFGDLVFATPKPEKLLKRIIELATNEGNLVVDFFLGSGTTAAVAHKMKRQYIGIDQMDYTEKVAVNRLKKVIAGEQGGVSAVLNWKGGGSFKYMELVKPDNANQYPNFGELKNKNYKITGADITLNQKLYSLKS